MLVNTALRDFISQRVFLTTVRLTLFLTVSMMFSQSREIQIKNSLTNEKISFVSISMGSGTGFYSDSNGKFRISESENRIATLQHEDYIPTTVKFDTIKNTITLDPKPIELQEVKMPIQSRKRKYIKVKPIKISKNHPHAAFGTFGFEVAVLIRSNQNDKIRYISKVSIPFELDDLWMKINKLRDPPSILIKITFFQNNLNYPDEEKPISESEYFHVDARDIVKGRSTVKLINPIKIPNDGVYMVVTFLGKTNNEGDLIIESPSRIEEYNQRRIVFQNYIPIQLPLAVGLNFEKSLARNFFNTIDKKFYKVTPPLSLDKLTDVEKTQTDLRLLSQQCPDYYVPIELTLFSYE